MAHSAYKEGTARPCAVRSAALADWIPRGAPRTPRPDPPSTRRFSRFPPGEFLKEFFGEDVSRHEAAATAVAESLAALKANGAAKVLAPFAARCT